MIQADYCFTDGRVVNVYTGEILKDSVAVAGERIVYVGPSPQLIGPETEIIDVAGDYLIPGFFDAHAHADLFYNPISYSQSVLARGTTAFFNDGHDLAATLGRKAFLDLMARLEASPLSVFTGVPAASPPHPGLEGGELWSKADLAAALGKPQVLAISEVTPFVRLLAGDPELVDKLKLARSQGCLIEGHTTGASQDKLNQLALAGLTSCHESLTAADVLARLRLGYGVMLRHGSIRRDLSRLMPAVRQVEGYDLSRLMLVSDGIFADHLLSWGNMDWVVAEAVGLGLEPVRAIQMATLNPARYFRLDHLLGAIAPGRLAHLLIVPDLARPTPRLVMAKGTVAAREGRLTDRSWPTLAPDLGHRPFTLTPPPAEAFRVPAGPVTVPVIEIVDLTVTRRRDTPLPIRDVFYQAEGDVLALVFFSRDGSLVGRGFVGGFIEGTEPGLGGLASTVAHETHGLLVAGQNEADMALAASLALKMGGGIVLVHDGRVRTTLPLPLGGICSLAPIPALAGEIQAFHQALAQLGCSLSYPLWTFVFLSFTSVLGPRITDQGVYPVKTRQIIFP